MPRTARRLGSARDDSRRRPRGHEPRHPSAGRPVRPRQRPLAGRDRDPLRPLQLGAVRGAGRRGRGAGPRDHRGAAPSGRPTASRSTRTPARSATSTPPSWTRTRSTQLGTAPVRPLIDAVDGAARRPRPGGVPRRVRADRRPRPVRLLRRHRRPQLRPLPRSTSSRAGSGCPTSPTTATTSSPRSATEYVAYLDAAARARPSTTTPAGRRAARSSRSTPGWPQGHWERAETRDVQKTYNLTTAEELEALVPVLRLGRLRHQPRRRRRRPSPRSCVRQPSYLAHLSTVLDEVPIEDWKAVAAQPRAARRRRRTSPTTSSRPTSTSTAAPSTAPPSCAPAGSAASRWSRARSARPSARSTSPATSRRESKALMDELVANLLEAYRQSIAALDWMTEETKQRAYEKLETFRPKIGYPEKFRDYSALAGQPRRPARQRRRGRRRSRPTASCAKIGSPVDRDEWFMLPQTVNAYYNPGTNEICFPAGHPAEAVLQPRRRPGRELRRHRRGDRPRDRPRLRRPGRAVRRRRQPQRLVDRRRQGGVRGEVEGADRAVRRLRAARPARRARQRRADRRREHRRPRRPDHRPQGLPHLPRRRPAPIEDSRRSGCS